MKLVAYVLPEPEHGSILCEILKAGYSKQLITWINARANGTFSNTFFIAHLLDTNSNAAAGRN
jgi:hypothetical protein